MDRKEGRMNDPIQIDKSDSEHALRKQKHEQRIQWGFLVILGAVVLGFVIPLATWLTRLALGG